ncbi:MAG: hypothetical protein AMXMBFR33_56330 [Candidatus Xenobia bacterium]
MSKKTDAATKAARPEVKEAPVEQALAEVELLRRQLELARRLDPGHA